jgi:hypothetical protein
MEMVEGAKKGRMKNIKENYYINHFNHVNKLIEEQKHTKQSDNHNSLFDIVVRFNTRQQLRHVNARQNSTDTRIDDVTTDHHTQEYR